jgi:MoCo/4Fe-4S cofactor protein with predicted Tat translocation signal
VNIRKKARRPEARIGNWQLAIANPPRYWRSLAELADTPEFQRWREAEFPEGFSDAESEIHRRDFLRLMGASLALAGFGACTKQPIEKIVPYVKQPEEMIPGKPLSFATATTFAGYGQGLTVRSNEGRPTKIEGNRDHPASLGATTIWAQADLLDLYDPDRAQSITNRGQISTWGVFLQQLNDQLVRQTKVAGSGLRVLAQSTTSPTLLAQLQALLKKFPQAKIHSWDPLTSGSLGSETRYDLTRANVIVALDSDFFYLHPFALGYARDFASGRRLTGPAAAQMNRLYVAEPTPTVTGSNADHRLSVAARNVITLARALAEQISGRNGWSDAPFEIAKWIDAAVQDLRTNRGRSLVVAGETQPAEVHDIVREINAALGNVSTTVSRPSSAAAPDELDSLWELVSEMNAGAVELLIMLGGNPVYDAPVDFEFARALAQVKLRIHHSLHANETSRLSHWLIPATHFLESWSDVRSIDGTVSIVQPLIEPLYAGISAHEFVEAVVQQPVRSAYEIVRGHWQGSSVDPEFAMRWRKALSDGRFEAIGGDDFQSPVPAAAAGRRSPSLNTDGSVHLELVFRPDPNVLDGRYTNNGWLQELPRPFTKLTWDNAALVSPKLADREKLENGDVVELGFRGRSLRAPIWIMPGQAENSVTLHLGYGRTAAGGVGNNVGCNAYALRTSDALWHGDGLTIRKTGEKHEFASAQQHHSMEGRDILREGTVADFIASGTLSHQPEPLPNETLLNPDEFENNGYAWGMVIDLNACIGCSACTIACQAENNIPVVGKAQVARGREMHWIRVDTYHAGSASAPEFSHQPVPCMHCEHAPCELVCPVGATVHDNEGLNLQVYNRCVGTRYCSNNCPYKVRRFNFLELNGHLSPVEKLGKNPDVTVRSRGVMEKCTYCVQRINAARYAAELDNDRRIRDGEIIPACAQVCPTEAIVFGDIHNPRSRVSKLRSSPLNYHMLAELNTRPRTSYLAKLRNPREAMNS